MAEDSTIKLQRLLGELFQVESADLDFGIYRIMRQRRGEIRKFIEKDLSETVKKECAAIKATPEETAAIFDHIYQFFSRYYDKGDFMPLHRHSLKERKYAVPWNGEEVVLHWANKDQYYIKTGMNFRDYVFRDEQETYRIHFTLVEGDVPKNNVKEKDSYFILQPGKDAITFDKTTKTLTVRFIYIPLSSDEAKKQSGAKSDFQKAFSKTAEDAILAAAKSADTGLFNILSKKEEKKKTDKTEPPTYLAKHLTRYVHENKSDFFIHKDLGGFLRQELDTYLKREMYDLNDLIKDDTVAQDPALYKSYFERIRLMRSISLKIIDFLAQIEDFQKRLWEKKKFVLKSEYCMTLDHVPEKFYKDILKNKAQNEEWKNLYGIGGKGGQATLAGSTINETFLKAHPYLVLDTAFFPELKDQLIDSLQTPDGKPVKDLDDATGGLMVKSENWQALNLLQERFREQVKCIYIDPPYNTGNDEFLYKDYYQHSSWLSMMADRLILSNNLLKETGAFFCTTDDNEFCKLSIVLDSVFNHENFIASCAWQKVFARKNKALISKSHDYIPCYSKSISKWDRSLIPRTSEQISAFKNPDNDPRGPWQSVSFSVQSEDAARRQQYRYPITLPNRQVVYPPTGRHWNGLPDRYQELLTDNRIWFGEDGSNAPREKIFLSEVQEGIVPDTWWSHTEFGNNQEAKKEILSLFGDSEPFSTPKPVKLLKQIIVISTSNKTEHLILDYFAGSGTTAHAVLSSNRDDKGNRKYIREFR